MKNYAAAISALVLVFLSSGAQAEVIDSASNGFTVRQTVLLPATRAEAYGAAVGRISQWWSSDHTISGDAKNLYISAVPNGCFCEQLGPDGGLIHMAVTFVSPGVMLRFTGGLGPLGLMGVNGNMTWEFNENEQGTELVLNYAVGGYLDGGLDAIAPAVDQVLGEQLQSLASLLASGAMDN